MKQSNIFLFYYSLISVTIVLIASFFFLPSPQKIINAVLLVPAAFYLWVNAISPDFFTTTKWSPKLGAISIVFCILGVFGYFLSTKFTEFLPAPALTASVVKTEDTTQPFTGDTDLKNYFDAKFDILNTKIDTIGKRDFGVLGLTVPPDEKPEEPVIGQITVKDANLTEIPVYDVATSEGKVVGKAKFGITYPYSEKTDSWYKTLEGWVEARWFKEVSP